MAEKQIRLLHANEIECRVGYINEKGLSLLLYKDARIDMKILDEVYGASNWQRRHELIGGNLYCTVSVWDAEKGQWISKQDVGTKSNTEKEKGEASDSFKRACFSHGIGRELYTAPFIWISAGKTAIRKEGNRYITKDTFEVKRISYNENREITGLLVINQDGREVYHLEDRKTEKREIPAQNADFLQKAAGPEMGKAQVQGQVQIQEQEQRQVQEKIRMEALNKELARTGIALDRVLERYGISDLSGMDEGTYRKAMNSLRRTKTKAA